MGVHYFAVIGSSATLACVAGLIAAVTAVNARAQALRHERWRTVVRVIDGDTIELDHGERVRLIGVDTPEMSDFRGRVHYYGYEAFQFTSRMVRGKLVRLEFDWERKDKYRRTLAYVFLFDGTFLNAEIIRQGHGFALTRFPFKYLEQFRALERDARERGVGLWAAPADGLPPTTRSQTVVPKAPTAPLDEWTCPSSAPIKGNVSTRTGQCIYHVPGGQFYEGTKPEHCFATEATALAARCRRARR